MQDILDPHHLQILEGYRHPHTLVALDYDGTLAPIVADRERALMRDSTRELLYQVASKFRTVVISGRARDDLLRFVGDIPIADAVGNHGCEALGLDASNAISTVNSWCEELSSAFAGIAGIDIENKRLSLAVHYRFASRQAADVVQREVEKLKNARIVTGKMVLNAVPMGLPNKGDALLRLCRIHRSEKYIFVGDDDTDEDIFSLTGAMPGLGIRVGYSDSSGASHFIENQLKIETLLRKLLDCDADDRPT